MSLKDIEETAEEVLLADSERKDEDGKYHPSTLSSCPLKTTLDKMTESEPVLNSWLLQGSAVHYYLQETGLLDGILHKAGFPVYNTEYEVHRMYNVNDEVTITGRCDILTGNDDEQAVIDIKYTSLKPYYDNGRLMKYYSQVNVYANMFGVDRFGLFMINSKSNDLTDDGIHMMTGDRDEENWEMMKQRAIDIHDTLEYWGWEAGDNPISVSELDPNQTEFWEEHTQFIDTDQCPAYDEECKYCDFNEVCPVFQGTMGNGLNQALNQID